MHNFARLQFRSTCLLLIWLVANTSRSCSIHLLLPLSLLSKNREQQKSYTLLGPQQFPCCCYSDLSQAKPQTRRRMDIGKSDPVLLLSVYVPSQLEQLQHLFNSLWKKFWMHHKVISLPTFLFMQNPCGLKATWVRWEQQMQLSPSITSLPC